MSHFITCVMVPDDTDPDEIEGVVADLLQPYDEAISVAPYDTECWCIGSAAVKAGQALADQTVVPLATLRDQYWALPAEQRPEWETWAAAWNAAATAAEQAHPLYQKPSPECSECHGTGHVLTRYNPNSQWDWWSIGGRWDGWLSATNRAQAQTAAQNGKIPLAVVTPDGVWHQRGEIGYWGVTDNEKDPDDWAREVQSLFSAHPTSWVVACDLHI